MEPQLKKKKTTGGGKEIPIQIQVPDDVIEDILMKLPVKSVIRFKHAVLSGRDFRRAHYIINKNTNTLILAVDRVIDIDSLESLCSETQRDQDHTAAAEIVLKDFDWSLIQQQQPSESPLEVNVTCCCEGILCLVSKNFILLWIPRINEFKRLPIPDKFHQKPYPEVGFWL